MSRDDALNRLLLIVNPRAGGGRGGRLLASYLALLERAGYNVAHALTRDITHADVLAEQALAEDRVAVAVGGDGLVGRVAGAAAELGALMAVLPAGRGNDFARALGIPADPAGAVDTLALAVERQLDLGCVDGRPFACIASVGFDSVVQEFALRTRLPLGAQVYTVGAVKAAASWRHATFRIHADGVASTLRGWAVAAANTGIYGGGMHVAPDADPGDGLLDVVTTAATGRVRFLRSFPKVFAGTHVHQPEVTVLRARTVRIDADRPFRVFADGDPIGVLPCTVSILPGALRVLAPPEGTRKH